MLGGVWSTGVVVLVVALATVFSAIPGPNDRRYPDYIVDPRVACEKEGSFPHPRNCSWYYRCVDRMNVGMFWTYYFECEPGTVFSDDLDQCVHPFNAKPPCGQTTTPPVVLPCQGVPGTCKHYDICKPTKTKKYLCDQIHCPLRTPNLQCGTGYAYDMDKRECALKPADRDLCGYKEPVSNISISEMAKLPCSHDNLRPKTDFISRVYCDNYALCNGGKFKENKQLCRSYYECYLDGEKWKAYTRQCPSGSLYSYELDKCELQPSADELCKPTNP